MSLPYASELRSQTVDNFLALPWVEEIVKKILAASQNGEFYTTVRVSRTRVTLLHTHFDKLGYSTRELSTGRLAISWYK